MKLWMDRLLFLARLLLLCGSLSALYVMSKNERWLNSQEANSVYNGYLGQMIKLEMIVVFIAGMIVTVLLIIFTFG